jgi:hypothetical protein
MTYVIVSPPRSESTQLAAAINEATESRQDLWIRFAVESTRAEWCQAAQQVRDQLDIERNVLVEYGCKLWDGASPDYDTVNRTGLAQGMPGANQYYAGSAYVIERSLRIFEAFDHYVAMDGRARGVLNIGGNLDTYAQALETVYRSPILNKLGTRIDVLTYGADVSDADATALQDADGIATRMRV